MQGQSRLANNLYQIAKAAHIGVLAVSPALIEALESACRDIRIIRTPCCQPAFRQRGAGRMAGSRELQTRAGGRPPDLATAVVHHSPKARRSVQTELTIPKESFLADLETLLIALDMHLMFIRQPFKILRLKLLEMKTDGLTPDLQAPKAWFSAMPDAELFAALGALHNPFRLQDRVLN